MALKFLDGAGLQYTLTGFIEKADVRYLGKNENAVSASKLATSRKINNTAFDGSHDITTVTWGTARTITIGNASKSIDGSKDVTFTLAEMNAATIQSVENVAQSVVKLKEELLGGETELVTLKALADEIENEAAAIRNEMAEKTAQATDTEINNMLSDILQ